MTKDRGPYIRTVTGEKFFPLDPHPDEVHLPDIAHHLSGAPRWSGSTQTPYSVAQHSVWCMNVAIDNGATEREARAMLFHDASEAYICDIPKPLKCLFKGYKEVEEKIMQAVAERFEFDWPLAQNLKEIDNLALVVERMSLFLECEWFLAEDYADLKHLHRRAYSLRFTPPSPPSWSNYDSENEFLRAHVNLHYAAADRKVEAASETTV